MNLRLCEAFEREKDFKCPFQLHRFAKRELCWKFDSRHSPDLLEEECCLCPQQEDISGVSFLVCLSVFACTPAHSTSPTTSTQPDHPRDPRGLGVRATPERRGYLDPGHEPLRSQGSQGAGRGREELGDERERPGRGPQGGDALSSARGTSQLFSFGPHGPAVCDEGGVQRRGGTDEGTCEEIEEAHPINH